MPRTTWVTTTAAALREQLATRGWELDQSAAEQFVRDRRDGVVELARVSPATAQQYVDEDIINDWADALTENHPLGPPPPRQPVEPTPGRHLRAVN